MTRIFTRKLLFENFLRGLQPPPPPTPPRTPMVNNEIVLMLNDCAMWVIISQVYTNAMSDFFTGREAEPDCGTADCELYSCLSRIITPPPLCLSNVSGVTTGGGGGTVSPPPPPIGWQKSDSRVIKLLLKST